MRQRFFDGANPIMALETFPNWIIEGKLKDAGLLNRELSGIPGMIGDLGKVAALTAAGYIWGFSLSLLAVTMDGVSYGFRGLASLRHAPILSLSRFRDSWFVVREGGGADAPLLLYWANPIMAWERNGFRISDLGFREGVPLMRHEYLWGFSLRLLAVTMDGVSYGFRGLASLRHAPILSLSRFRDS